MKKKFYIKSYNKLLGFELVITSLCIYGIIFIPKFLSQEWKWEIVVQHTNAFIALYVFMYIVLLILSIFSVLNYKYLVKNKLMEREFVKAFLLFSLPAGSMITLILMNILSIVFSNDI